MCSKDQKEGNAEKTDSGLRLLHVHQVIWIWQSLHTCKGNNNCQLSVQSNQGLFWFCVIFLGIMISQSFSQSVCESLSLSSYISLELVIQSVSQSVSIWVSQSFGELVSQLCIYESVCLSVSLWVSQSVSRSVGQSVLGVFCFLFLSETHYSVRSATRIVEC